MKIYKPKRDKYWTVLVIPTYYGKTTSLKIPVCLLRFSAVAVIVVISFNIFLFVSFLKLTPIVKHYEELKIINRQQQYEILRFKEEEKAILNKIQAVEQLVSQVRDLIEFSTDMPGEVKAGSMGGGIPLNENYYGLSSFINYTLKYDLGIIGDPIFGFRDWTDIIQQINNGLKYINPLLDDKVNCLESLKKDVDAHLEYLAAIPNKWPLDGYITSRFGNRRSPFGGGRKFHGGLDIAANKGTAILAAGKGKVIFAGTLTSYGKTVIIDPKNGYKTQYSHASSILVEKDQLVEKGEPIARVGSTGRSTGPHLHFSVYKNGKLCDPLEVLP